MKNGLTYSGISPLGTTILRVSCMRLYFIILSADVVEVSEGEAFTWKSNVDFSLVVYSEWICPSTCLYQKGWHINMQSGIGSCKNVQMIVGYKRRLIASPKDIFWLEDKPIFSLFGIFFLYAALSTLMSVPDLYLQNYHTKFHWNAQWMKTAE